MYIMIQNFTLKWMKTEVENKIHLSQLDQVESSHL